MVTLDPSKRILINTTRWVSGFVDDQGNFSINLVYNQETINRWPGKAATAVQIVQNYDTSLNNEPTDVSLLRMGVGFSTTFAFEATIEWNNVTTTTALVGEQFPVTSANFYTESGFSNSYPFQTYSFILVPAAPVVLPSRDQIALFPYLNQSQQLNLGHGSSPVNTPDGQYLIHVYAWIEDTAIPPLRIYQRQDGLGAQGHARHNQIGASNSGSENTGHRLKGSNTYG